MTQPQRFPIVQTQPAGGIPLLMPMVPIELISPHAAVQATGLVDSGATVSVMPFDLGIKLGLDWHKQHRYPIQLTGNLANYAARGVAIDAVVRPFPTVRQLFAWTQANPPLILGNYNFFLEFDVCFFLARMCIEVQPKQ